MKIIILCIVAFFTLAGCTRTENGLVFGTPAYEKKNIPVSQTDLDVLLSAQALLADPVVWVKNDIRSCDGKPPYNLYCALEAASLQVDGNYIHRRPALQEVRFVIDDKYKKRWKVHRLADFNNHPDTTFADIKLVLKISIDHVKDKLLHQNRPPPSREDG